MCAGMVGEQRGLGDLDLGGTRAAQPRAVHANDFLQRVSEGREEELSMADTLSRACFGGLDVSQSVLAGVHGGSALLFRGGSVGA